MTVEQNIFELNTKFQKSYHEGDWQFFQETMPNMLNEIKDFIYSIIIEGHKLRYDIDLKLDATINHEFESAKKIGEIKNPSCKIKDNYINSAKVNVSEALNYLHRQLTSMDAPMLQQVL